MAKKANNVEETILEATEEVAAVEETPATAIVVNCTKLNVRKTGSKNGEIIGTVDNGDKLTVVKEGKGWIKIEFKELSGYVMSDYIRLV